jgi:hypothetical protein
MKRGVTCPWHARPLVGRRRRGRDPAAQPAPSWKVPRPPRLAHYLTNNIVHGVTTFLFSMFLQLTPRPRIQFGLLRVLGFSAVYSARSKAVIFHARFKIVKFSVPKLV